MSKLDDRLKARAEAAAAEAEAAAGGVLTGRVVPASQIPDPQEPETDDDTLTSAEEKRLAEYEAVLGEDRDTWWRQGKALAGIVKGDLVRRDYPSLVAYLRDRWEGMPRPVAYRRMEQWSLGERLSPIGDSYGVRFNEAQSRDFLAYWKAYGLDAVEAVYRTLVETDGVKVTANVIQGATSVLLAAGGDYNKDTHVGLVREFLAGTLEAQTPSALPPAPDPGEQVEKFLATIGRFNIDRFRDADPAARKEVAERLRAMADELTAE